MIEFQTSEQVFSELWKSKQVERKNFTAIMVSETADEQRTIADGGYGIGEEHGRIDLQRIDERREGGVCSGVKREGIIRISSPWSYTVSVVGHEVGRPEGAVPQVGTAEIDAELPHSISVE